MNSHNLTEISDGDLDQVSGGSVVIDLVTDAEAVTKDVGNLVGTAVGDVKKVFSLKII